MSKTTEAILVEVTSSLSLDACRHTADELLAKVLELGCCARFVRAPDGSEHPEPTTPPGLPNQQVPCNFIYTHLLGLLLLIT